MSDTFPADPGDWEAKYNALQKQFDEFQVQSEEFEQELEQDKLIIEKELEQKEREYEKVLKERNRLDDQLHRERETHSNSANDISKYLKEIKLLKAKNIKSSREIQKLETANDKYENEVRAMTQDLETANSKLEEQLEENIFLKNDLEDLKREFVETKEHLQLEIKDQKDEIEFLKRNNTTANRDDNENMATASVTALASQFEANDDKNKGIREEDSIMDDMFNSRESLGDDNSRKLRTTSASSGLPPPPVPPPPSKLPHEEEEHEHENDTQHADNNVPNEDSNSEELAELRMEVEELSNAMDEMSEEMEHLTEELQTKSNSIKTLESQLTKTQNLLLASKEENEKLVATKQSTTKNSSGKTQVELAEITRKYNDSCTAVTDLTAKITTLETELQETQTLLLQKQETFDNEIRSRKTEIQELNAKLAKHQNFLETHEALHNSTTEKHSKEMDAIKAKHVNAMSAMESTHDTVVGDMKSKHETAITEIKTQYEEMIANHKTSMENMETKHRETINNMNTKYMEEIKVLKATHDGHVTSAKTEHDAMIATMKTANEKALSEKITALEKKHEENIKKLEKVHNDHILRVKNDCANLLQSEKDESNLSTDNAVQQAKLQLTAAHQSQMEETIDKYEKVTNEHLETIKSLESQLEDAQEEKKAQEKTIFILKDQLEVDTKGKSEQEEQQEKEVSSLNRTLSDLERKLKKSTEKYNSLFKESKERQETDSNSISELKGNIQELHLTIVNMEKEIDQHKEQRKEQEKTVADAEVKYDRLAKSYTQAQSDLNVKIKENNRLESELKDARNVQDDLEQQFQQLSLEVKEHHTYIKTQEKETEELHGKYKMQLQDQERKYEQKIEEFQSRINKLTSTKEGGTEDKTIFTANVKEELEFTIQTLENELEERRESNAKQLEDYNALSVENEAHKQDILHLHSQIRMFAIKNKKLESDINEHNDDNRTLQDQLYEEINELKLESAKLSDSYKKELHERDVQIEQALQEKGNTMKKLKQRENSLENKTQLISELKRQLFVLKNPTTPSPRSPRFAFNKHEKYVQCNLQYKSEDEVIDEGEPPLLSLNELSVTESPIDGNRNGIQATNNSNNSQGAGNSSGSSSIILNSATETKSKLSFAELLHQSMTSDNNSRINISLYNSLQGNSGGSSSGSRRSEQVLLKKIKKLQNDLSILKYNKKEHEESKAMLAVLTDEHAKLQRKLKNHTSKTNGTSKSQRSTSSSNVKPGANTRTPVHTSRNDNSNKNKAVIKNLQTKNQVLNGEIKRLRAKLIMMKQKNSVITGPRKTPSKMSIAERLKLRRRGEGKG